MAPPKSPDYQELDFCTKRILAMSRTIAEQFRGLSDEEKIFCVKTLDMLEAVTQGVTGRSNLALLHLGINIIQEQSKELQVMLQNRKKLN